MGIQAVAFIAGIILGSIAVLSAVYVWVKDRTFGMGGGALSLAGIVLVGLSIWSSVRIKVNESGLEADFNRLQSQVSEVTKTSLAVTDEVRKIAESTQANKDQFLKLTSALETRQVVRPEVLAAIEKPIESTPTADRKAIDAAAIRLRNLDKVILER
jgi:hypothetical protein